MQPKHCQVYLIIVGISYCFYDLFVCIFKTKTTLKERSDIYLHHLMGLCGAGLSLYLGHQNTALGAACLLTEASTIPMNIRWLMLKHKMTNSVFYLPVNIGFMLSFFLSRVFFLVFLQARNFQILQTVTFDHHGYLFDCL